MNRTKTHNAPYKILTAALVGVACFLIFGQGLQASSLTLTWRPPESGPEVAGYYLYINPASPAPVRVDVGNVTSHVVHDLEPGTLYAFYVTAYNPHGLESDPSNTFEYRPPDPGFEDRGAENHDPVIIDLMANSGQVQSPMVIASDPLTPQGVDPAAEPGHVYSPVAGSGSVTFQFEVPHAGDYVVWCRMFAPVGWVNSIQVAVNDEEPDAYYPTEGADPETWYWSRVNGVNTGLPYGVRLFHMRQGVNSIRFLTVDPYVSLSRIVVTDDLEFVPDGAIRNLQQAPNVSIVRTDEGTILRWPSVKGNNYHIFYKNDLSHFHWLRPNPINFLQASGPVTEWVDRSNNQSRFYLVYAAP